MKLKDLLEKFNQSDLDKDVFMASDAEGNSYHDIDEVCTAEDGSLVLFPEHDSVIIDEGEDDDGELDPFAPIEGDAEIITEEEMNAPHNQDIGKSEN